MTRPAPNPAEGVEVPYDALGFRLSPSAEGVHFPHPARAGHVEDPAPTPALTPRTTAIPRERATPKHPGPGRHNPGIDPGPDAPDDRRPAYAVVPGRPRLVAERAVALLEEVAATWPPDAARAVWNDPDAKDERDALRKGVGYDRALCARLDAAKRLMLARASTAR